MPDTPTTKAIAVARCIISGWAANLTIGIAVKNTVRLNDIMAIAVAIGDRPCTI